MLFETYVRGSSVPLLLDSKTRVLYGREHVGGAFQPLGLLDDNSRRLQPSQRARAALSARIDAEVGRGDELDDLLRSIAATTVDGGAGGPPEPALDARAFYTFCCALVNDVYPVETNFYVLLFVSVFGRGGVASIPACRDFLTFVTSLDRAAANPGSSPELLHAIARLREQLTDPPRREEARAAFERIPQPRQADSEGILTWLLELPPQQQQLPESAGSPAEPAGGEVARRGGQGAHEARLLFAYVRARNMHMTGQISFKDVLRACGAVQPQVVAATADWTVGGVFDSIAQVSGMGSAP